MIGMIRMRYIVDDVDKAVEFYTSNLDFQLEQQFGPAIAILERDGVQLLVSGPNASASRPMPDGSKPIPGGWNWILISVDDLESVVSRLKQNGVRFKNDIIEGPGGKQILCLDPSENVVELFQPV
jgi:predicted enzyme related to lactoylglutathione lyase